MLLNVKKKKTSKNTTHTNVHTHTQTHTELELKNSVILHNTKSTHKN